MRITSPSIVSCTTFFESIARGSGGRAGCRAVAIARVLYLRMHPYGEARTRHPSIPPGLLARAVNGRSALLRERVDAVTAEVVPALAGGGVRALLLKGPATVVWLYDNEHGRSYVDTDVLVSPDDLASAGAVLRRLGF